jgi:hypothetical protein
MVEVPQYDGGSTTVWCLQYESRWLQHDSTMVTTQQHDVLLFLYYGVPFGPARFLWERKMQSMTRYDYKEQQYDDGVWQCDGVALCHRTCVNNKKWSFF